MAKVGGAVQFRWIYSFSALQSGLASDVGRPKEFGCELFSRRGQQRVVALAVVCCDTEWRNQRVQKKVKSGEEEEKEKEEEAVRLPVNELAWGKLFLQVAGWMARRGVSGSNEEMNFSFIRKIKYD